MEVSANLVNQGNFESAQSILVQFMPEFTAQSVLKNVLGIKINVFERDSIYLTEEEAEFLEPIANADALFYGPGVYIARALLAIIGENIEKNSINPPINHPNVYLDKKVWPCPNPSNGILKFCSNIQSDTIYNLEIINLQGYKLVSIPNFNLKSKGLDISFLKSGVYYFKLSNGIDSFRGNIILTINK
jgi:hypothetical protein